MGARHVDFALPDARQREQGRDRKAEGDQEHRSTGDEITGGAHHGRGDAIAERGKPRVAPEPLADRKRPDQAEADRGDRGTQHAACGGMQGRGDRHHRKNRQGCVSERGTADGRDREPRDQPFRAGCIDDGATRHLSDQADHAADREHQADLRLGPFFRGEVDRDERAEAGLHVGEKEDEPVEAAQALLRRMRLVAGGTRRKRHNVILADRLPLAITIVFFARMKRARDQDAPPPCLVIEIEG